MLGKDQQRMVVGHCKGWRETKENPANTQSTGRVCTFSVSTNRAHGQMEHVCSREVSGSGSTCSPQGWCGTVRRDFSSPGHRHLAFGPSPSSSCRSPRRREKQSWGRKRKRETSNLFSKYWNSQAGNDPTQLHLYPPQSGQRISLAPGVHAVLRAVTTGLHPVRPCQWVCNQL